MLRGQKIRIFVIIGFVLLALGLCGLLCYLYRFNPFTWLATHTSSLVVGLVIILVIGLWILGFVLRYRKRV